MIFTRDGLHDEFNFNFQVEAQTIKADIKFTQERTEAKIEAT
jgi:hypothetical protein